MNSNQQEHRRPEVIVTAIEAARRNNLRKRTAKIGLTILFTVLVLGALGIGLERWLPETCQLWRGFWESEPVHSMEDPTYEQPVIGKNTSIQEQPASKSELLEDAVQILDVADIEDPDHKADEHPGPPKPQNDGEMIQEAFSALEKGDFEKAQALFWQPNFRKYRIVLAEDKNGLEPESEAILRSCLRDLETKTRWRLYCLSVCIDASREANFWLYDGLDDVVCSHDIHEFRQWELGGPIPSFLDPEASFVMVIDIRNSLMRGPPVGHPGATFLANVSAGGPLYYASFGLDDLARTRVLEKLIRLRPGWVKGINRAREVGVEPTPPLAAIRCDEGNAPFEIEEEEVRIDRRNETEVVREEE